MSTRSAVKPRWPGAFAERPRAPWERRPRVGFRAVVRGVGKGLITTGVLIMLFLGYQLWGTGLTEQRQQRALAAEFSERLGASPPAADIPAGETPATSRPTGAGDVPTLSEPLPEAPAAAGGGAELGEPIGQLEIPKLGLDKFVVEGVGVEELKGGPGHYPGTALPGELGNAAIAGHRTTYGAPFYRLNELLPGDPIFVTSATGRYRYDVSELKIVTPGDVWVLDPTDDNRLTLTTCHPRYSAAERLIVIAQLMNPPPPPAAPTPAPPSQAEPPAQREPPASVLTAERAGLSGGVAAKGPAVVWGAAAAFVGLAAQLMARRGRRWLVYAVSAPVFLVVLFQFYENVARLLPANV